MSQVYFTDMSTSEGGSLEKKLRKLLSEAGFAKLIKEGELVAVPVSGAYQLSMASNYNGALRPAIVWLNDGKAKLVRRRERVEDLVDRDLSL